MILLVLTLHDGHPTLVVGENICSVVAALSTDPKHTQSALSMTNNNRICVMEDMVTIKSMLDKK